MCMCLFLCLFVGFCVRVVVGVCVVGVVRVYDGFCVSVRTWEMWHLCSLTGIHEV